MQSLFTLAEAAYAIGKTYFFGGKGDPPPGPYLGPYFFGGKGDDPPSPSPPPLPPLPPPPPRPPPLRDSYYSSSSYNGGTTRTQTLQSYRSPSSSPSYTYRPPASYAHSQMELCTS